MKRNRAAATDSGPTTFHVQLFSESARLVREFRLDARRYGLADLEAAEDHLRRTLTPCDFTSTVSLCIGDRPSEQAILQFELDRA
ncbi:MAG: hypothetical protein R3176_02580 [Woeseiaceae bacterium]|nr:hypothetical protein [Woeseiaceae bacterium]